MRVRIRGRYWRLLRGRLPQGIDGLCDPPTSQEKAITIRRRLPLADELRVLIHEMLHAGDWDKSEEAVDELSSDIARVLLRDGWTKVR